MTTTGLKKKLVTAINKEEDEGLLKLVYAIISEHSSEKRISKKQYNQEMDEVAEEIAQGKVVSHDFVVKESRKWLRKK